MADEDREAGGPCEVRALAWWSDLRLQALEAKLADACAGWARRWGTTPPAVAVGHAWDRAARGNGVHGWESVRAAAAPAAPVAWIADTAALATAVADAWFGTASADALPETRDRTGLARAIADDAAGALRSAVLGPLGLAATSAGAGTSADPCATPPASDFRRWSGALVVSVRFGAHADPRWLMHLSREALAPLSPPPARRRPDPPLVPLREALAGHALHLQARLDAGTLALSDLFSLRPGDVILTGHRLSEPLQIAARGMSAREGAAAALCGGQLGRRDALRAVRLIAAPGARSA